MTPASGVPRLAGLAVMIVMASVPGSALAQTRAEEIQHQQAQKAAQAQPYQPSKAEKFFDQLESGKWFVFTPRTWYPMFGSIYPGGGFTAGAGYRRYIGYDSYVDTNGLISVTGSKMVQVVGYTPNHVHERVDFAGRVGWLDATRVAFYGLGIDSQQDDHVNFRLNKGYVEGSAMARPVRWLQLRLDGGVDDYTQKGATGPVRSIEQVFTAEDAPLLGQSPTYLRGEASVTAYWLQTPGYSRHGGLYRFAYEEFNPFDAGGTFGFARSEVIQHVPIFRDTWVLSLRGRTESIVRKSDVVPFFLMPYLGSGSTLRGYPTGRFRDRHTLLLNGELRWFPNRQALDLALFFDAGHVAPLRSELSLPKMMTDAGIGVRFHTPASTALRIDVAKGLEGWRVVFAASAPF